VARFDWSVQQEQRLAAIRDDLARVSTATAFTLLNGLGWRNTYMQGLQSLEPLGLGSRLVGRARTCRYLIRREAEAPAPSGNRQVSPVIALIESIESGDVFCVDALGVPTAGIIGDILSARLKVRGVVAAMVYGAVRDSPYIREVGLPVFSSAIHPAASMRDVVPVDYDVPVNLGGAQVLPGDVILVDDEGALAMPLDLAEYVVEHGLAKEHLEGWIRGKVEAGGSVHDYYPPTAEKEAEYERETGRRVTH